MKAEFPLAADGGRQVFDALAVPVPPLARDEYTLDQLVGELAEPDPDLRAVEVHKRRERYTVGGAMAELSEIRAAAGARQTIAIESEDPSSWSRRYGSWACPCWPNVCMARGLKALVGFGA